MRRAQRAKEQLCRIAEYPQVGRDSTRITEFDFWLHIGPPKIQTRFLRVLAKCCLNRASTTDT